MNIRRAVEADIPALDKLLYQVHKVHSDGRPDLFKPGMKKYTDEELTVLLKDDTRPVYVAEEDEVLGYAFCVHEMQDGAGSMYGVKSLYIDDLCVDAASRGKHVGTALFEFVKATAKAEGFDRVTLNVWALNDAARGFYDAQGMQPLKTTMELKL